MILILTKLIRLYQVLISPWLGHHCRFLPTCSAYAVEAIEKHGGFRGGKMAVGRILRCHPIKCLGGRDGFDPVP